MLRVRVRAYGRVPIRRGATNRPKAPAESASRERRRAARNISTRKYSTPGIKSKRERRARPSPRAGVGMPTERGRARRPREAPLTISRLHRHGATPGAWKFLPYLPSGEVHARTSQTGRAPGLSRRGTILAIRRLPQIGREAPAAVLACWVIRSCSPAASALEALPWLRGRRATIQFPPGQDEAPASDPFPAMPFRGAW